jgi:hypothetical protein
MREKKKEKASDKKNDDLVRRGGGRNMHTLDLIQFCYLLHAHSISIVIERNQIGYTLE